MTTLRASIKNAAQSVRTFLTKSTSKSSSPNEGTTTPGHHARKRKPVFGLFKEKEVATHPIIHAVGILGIVGGLKTFNSGWMVTDYAAWIFLISLMQGFHPDRSSWLSIRPVDHLFPGSSVVFGDAGCDRLVLPLPRLDSGINPNISAERFSSHCLLSLQRIAKNVKHGEKLVVLLVGHGQCDVLPDKGPTFHLQITEDPNALTGEASINKFMLEKALKKCRGEIVIICNSCTSGLLASDRWTLLCSAGPLELAEALSESHSEHVRGSVFTACAVAQMASEHGLQVPLPRDVERTDPTRIPLPSKPPSHSFNGTITEIPIQPSNVSFEDFVARMLEKGLRLVEHNPNEFQVTGPKATSSWTEVLPIKFTVEVMGQIGIKAHSSDYPSIYNAGCLSNRRQGQSLPSPNHGCLANNSLLATLATAMPDTEYLPRTPKAKYASVSAELRRHIYAPMQYAFPPQTDTVGTRTLLLVLKSYHVQDVAMQVLARELGWRDASYKVEIFLPQKIANWNFYEVIKSGIRIDELLWYLKATHFPWLWPKLDHNSAWWLWSLWNAAERPSIPRHQWDELVKKVGFMTKSEAIC